jgi:hypothetical protein
MARKPGLEFPGAIYHINHRGNHQEYIYLERMMGSGPAF